MQYPETIPRPAPSDPARRNRTVAVIGVLLAAFLIIELALEFALRTGWRTYRGLDSVNAVAVDGGGKAWAVGYRQGHESLMTFTDDGAHVEMPLPAELTNAHPIALMIDRQDRVWVGTDFGVIGMREEDGTWILFSPEQYGSDSTRQIIMDGQGRVWARSHRGPAELDPASGERTIRYRGYGIGENDAVALATDLQGQLWALTAKRELKVLEADGSWRTAVVVPGTVRNGFMDASLAFDPQGQIWLTTAGGVGVWSPDGAWKEHPLGDPHHPMSMRGVLTDAEGRVWVATWEQGLFRFDPEAGWTNYTARNSDLRGDVNALTLDAEGRLWVGSTQGRLAALDPEAALPAKISPIVRFGATALVPGILLLSLGLLAMRSPIQLGFSTASRRQIVFFALGFLTWYAIATLMWWFLLLSWPRPEGPVFFTINPLVVLAPVVHIILMVFFYRKQRQMARGALWAFLVNSMGISLLGPFPASLIAGPVASALLMIPVFLRP